MRREKKRRILRGRKLSGAIAKKNRDRVVAFVSHCKILVSITVEVARGKRTRVETHGNGDGLLKRPVAIAEQYVHQVRQGIAGDQIVAPTAGKRCRSYSRMSCRGCGARSPERDGGTRSLGKCSLIAALVQ